MANRRAELRGIDTLGLQRNLVMDLSESRQQAFANEPDLQESFNSNVSLSVFES